MSVRILTVSFLCMFASVISGCQTNSTNQSIVASGEDSWINSPALETAKKPKYAPFDWKPEDADSREVWFEAESSFLKH